MISDSDYRELENAFRKCENTKMKLAERREWSMKLHVFFIVLIVVGSFILLKNL